MRIRVRFFAGAREIVAADEVSVDLPAGSTAGDLRAALQARHPQLAPLLRHSMLAVNLAFVRDDFTLPEDGEVAVIPPVSGG